MVLRPGCPHEHRGAVAVLGEHFEPERFCIERGRSARIAHVEDRVVEPSHSRHDVRNLLNRSTIPGNTSTKRATSATDEDQPTDTRSDRSASTPIAVSTGDGSRVSDEHADPECTAIPC